MATTNLKLTKNQIDGLAYVARCGFNAYTDSKVLPVRVAESLAAKGLITMNAPEWPDSKHRAKQCTCDVTEAGLLWIRAAGIQDPAIKMLRAQMDCLIASARRNANGGFAHWAEQAAGIPTYSERMAAEAARFAVLINILEG